MEFEAGGPDGDVARLRMRRPMALLAAAFEREAHGIGMGHVAFERLEDGGLQFGGAMALRKLCRSDGDGVEIAARATTVGRDTTAPVIGLGIERLHIGDAAASKKLSRT